jgi:tetratricopeptide (TPR) repeat protein
MKQATPQHPRPPSGPRPHSSPGPNLSYQPSVILLIVACVLYANTVPFGYVCDDTIAITGNQYTKLGFAGIPKLFSTNFFEGYYGKNANMVVGGRYRPLSLITFAIEYATFGPNPHISHVINVLLYGLTAITLFHLFRYLLRSRRPPRPSVSPWYLSVPFIASLLFVTHPIHTEVVANIKGRDEILALLGSLLTLYSSCRFLETGKARYLAYATAAFFLGLFSKENAVTFLGVVPLTAYSFFKRSAKSPWPLYVLLALVSVAFVAMRQGIYTRNPLGLENDLMNNSFVGMTVVQKYATMVYTWGWYLKLLVVPHPLTSDYYPYHVPIVAITDVRLLASLMVLAALGYVAVRGRGRTVLSYSVAYYFLTFSVVSNLFVPVGTFMNERFLYMPSVAFCLALSDIALAPDRPGRRPWARVFGLSLLALMLVLFSAKTIVRNTVWASNFKLFTTDVRVSRNSSKANLQAGISYLDEARKASRDTLVWWQDAGQFAHMPQIEPGPRDTALRRGYYAAAIEHLERAVEIYPKNVPALFNLVPAYFESSKNYDAVVQTCRRLARINPDGDLIYLNLIGIMNTMPDSARYKEEVYREFYRANQKRYDLNSSLGIALGEQGRFSEALIYLRRASAIDPRGYDALVWAGLCHSRLGDWPRALEAFLEAEKIQPRIAQLLNNIAIVYQNMGNARMQEEYGNRAKRLGRPATGSR